MVGVCMYIWSLWKWQLCQCHSTTNHFISCNYNILYKWIQVKKSKPNYWGMFVWFWGVGDKDRKPKSGDCPQKKLCEPEQPIVLSGVLGAGRRIDALWHWQLQHTCVSNFQCICKFLSFFDFVQFKVDDTQTSKTDLWAVMQLQIHEEGVSLPLLHCISNVCLPGYDGSMHSVQ